MHTHTTTHANHTIDCTTAGRVVLLIHRIALTAGLGVALAISLFKLG